MNTSIKSFFVILSKILPLSSAIVLIFLILISCKPSDFERLQQNELSLQQQGNFQSYLALEYFEFSKRLKLSNDFKTSDYFAKKAVRMIDGERFIAENPFKWNSNKLNLEELILSQKRLERILFWPKLRDKLPIQLAHLAYLYDCWVSKESQIFFNQTDDTNCHRTYINLITELEKYVQNLNNDDSPKIKDSSPPEFTRFRILFDIGLFNITPSATKEIERVINYVAKISENYYIYLIGSGDSAKKDKSNEELSANRVGATKEVLIKNGIPNSLIFDNAKNDNLPSIITSDPNIFSDRYVEIYVIHGQEKPPLYQPSLLQNLYYRQEVKDAKIEQGYQ